MLNEAPVTQALGSGRASDVRSRCGITVISVGPLRYEKVAEKAASLLAW